MPRVRLFSGIFSACFGSSFLLGYNIGILNNLNDVCLFAYLAKILAPKECKGENAIENTIETNYLKIITFSGLNN